MPARHTQVTLFDMPSGTSWLDHFRSADLEASLTLADTRPLGGASNVGDYTREQVVKRTVKFNASLMQHSSTFRSNLDVSVFSINSVAHLGNLRSGSISVRNTFKEASGLAELDVFGQYISTDLTITGQLQIPLTETTWPLMTLGVVGTGADDSARAASMIIPYAITCGGSVVNGNAVLSSVAHRFSTDDVQIFDITLKGRGAPTTVTGHALLVDALAPASDALVGVRLNSGANDYTSGAGTAAILGCNLTFADSQINMLELELEMRGAMSVASS